jgi:hypothetical protein
LLQKLDQTKTDLFENYFAHFTNSKDETIHEKLLAKTIILTLVHSIAQVKNLLKPNGYFDLIVQCDGLGNDIILFHENPSPFSAVKRKCTITEPKPAMESSQLQNGLSCAIE